MHPEATSLKHGQNDTCYRMACWDGNLAYYKMDIPEDYKLNPWVSELQIRFHSSSLLAWATL